MLKKIFTLALGLVLAMAFVLFAEEQEVEIELIEVVGAGLLPGDNPLDDPGHSDYRNWKDVHCWHINDSLSAHHHNDAVDICAPGYEISSTNYFQNIGGYEILGKNGTSFAAPLVAGTAAMIRAVNPSLSAVQVMNILKQTADASIYDIPENAPYIGKLGAGRLDAYMAVRTACANDIENEIISEDCTLEGCVVTLKNVDVQDQINVTINPVVEAELISNVEIPLGSTLIIN